MQDGNRGRLTERRSKSRRRYTNNARKIKTCKRNEGGTVREVKQVKGEGK
jgi:hypothetical protein